MENLENWRFESKLVRDLDAFRFPLWMIEQHDSYRMIVTARQMCMYNCCCFKLFPLLCYVPTVPIKNIFWVTALRWSQFPREAI